LEERAGRVRGGQLGHEPDVHALFGVEDERAVVTVERGRGAGRQRIVDARGADDVVVDARGRAADGVGPGQRQSHTTVQLGQVPGRRRRLGEVVGVVPGVLRDDVLEEPGGPVEVVVVRQAVERLAPPEEEHVTDEARGFIVAAERYGPVEAPVSAGDSRRELRAVHVDRQDGLGAVIPGHDVDDGPAVPHDRHGD
jgi:hypothetical protein